MASYSVKMVYNVISNEALLYGCLDYTPTAIPFGHQVPETLNDQIQKILLGSGAITREAYDTMRGIAYDGDFENGTEPYGDDDYNNDDWDSFVQSNYANYFDEDSPVSESTLINENTPMKTIGEADKGEVIAKSDEQASDSALGNPSEVKQSDEAQYPLFILC